ncbi:MAG TPA: ABC transporter permease [Candidatus Kapabacteria bacterium]|nr:ABC transporter permease [Candidatus Kapabacteria bacterium]
MLSLVAKVGKKTTNAISEYGEMTVLLYRTLMFLPRMGRDRRLLLDQMEHIGTDSLPLVIVIGFFTGMVSAWQAAYQLEGFIPFSFIGSAVSRAIFIELGPVLTAIVIAGRVGASIAAELGTMKVTEQIDALESLAISPIRYLSTPRVVAATIMLPILTIFANTVALVGAFIVSNLFLDLTAKTFFGSVQSMFYLKDVIGGLFKALMFGLSTALIGVHVGFKTQGGAEGVGLATIRAFVLSSATVLIMDYVLWTIIFNA